MLAMMRKQPSKRAGGVTLKILLGHMQSMENRLVVKVDNGFKEIKNEIVAVRSDLAIERRQRRTQIENIDERVDQLEIEEIPTIKKIIGMRQ